VLYDLRRSDARVRWLVTLLLCTFGVAYAFGAWMVGMYAGFTTRSVAATYAEPTMTMPMPAETTMVVEHELTPAEMGREEQHRVDRALLVQDTHVHVPMYGVIAAVLSIVALGLAIPRWAGFGLITLLFAAPWLDFMGMWLTKLVSPHFALMTLAGGWAMGLGYTIVAVLAFWQMWRPDKGVRT
jgi:hypothetical protein